MLTHEQILHGRRRSSRKLNTEKVRQTYLATTTHRHANFQKQVTLKKQAGMSLRKHVLRTFA